MSKKLITEEEKIRPQGVDTDGKMINKGESSDIAEAFERQKRVTVQVRQKKLHKEVPSSAGVSVEQILGEFFEAYSADPNTARQEIYGQNADVYQELITVNLSQNCLDVYKDHALAVSVVSLSLGALLFFHPVAGGVFSPVKTFNKFKSVKWGDGVNKKLGNLLAKSGYALTGIDFAKSKNLFNLIEIFGMRGFTGAIFEPKLWKSAGAGSVTLVLGAKNFAVSVVILAALFAGVMKISELGSDEEENEKLALQRVQQETPNMFGEMMKSVLGLAVAAVEMTEFLGARLVLDASGVPAKCSSDPYQLLYMTIAGYFGSGMVALARKGLINKSITMSTSDELSEVLEAGAVNVIARVTREIDDELAILARNQPGMKDASDDLVDEWIRIATETPPVGKNRVDDLDPAVELNQFYSQTVGLEGKVLTNASNKSREAVSRADKIQKTIFERRNTEILAVTRKANLAFSNQGDLARRSVESIEDWAGALITRLTQREASAGVPMPLSRASDISADAASSSRRIDAATDELVQVGDDIADRINRNLDELGDLANKVGSKADGDLAKPTSEIFLDVTTAISDAVVLGAKGRVLNYRDIYQLTKRTQRATADILVNTIIARGGANIGRKAGESIIDYSSRLLRSKEIKEELIRLAGKNAKDDGLMKNLLRKVKGDDPNVEKLSKAEDVLNAAFHRVKEILNRNRSLGGGTDAIIRAQVEEVADLVVDMGSGVRRRGALGAETQLFYSSKQAILLISLLGGVFYGIYKLYSYGTREDGSSPEKIINQMDKGELANDAIIEAGLSEESLDYFEQLVDILGNRGVYSKIYEYYIFDPLPEGFISQIQREYENYVFDNTEVIKQNGYIVNDEFMLRLANGVIEKLVILKADRGRVIDTLQTLDDNEGRSPRLKKQSGRGWYKRESLLGQFVYTAGQDDTGAEGAYDDPDLGPEQQGTLRRSRPGQVDPTTTLPADQTALSDREKEKVLNLGNIWWPLLTKALIYNAGIRTRFRKIASTEFMKRYNKLLVDSKEASSNSEESQGLDKAAKIFGIGFSGYVIRNYILKYDNQNVAKRDGDQIVPDVARRLKGLEDQKNYIAIDKNIKKYYDKLSSQIEEIEVNELPPHASAVYKLYKKVQGVEESMSLKGLRKIVSEVIKENYGLGYSPYPYNSSMGEEEEPKQDYVEDWKALELALVRDKTRATAIEIAKILIEDLELFGDFIDLAGQNQSVGSELLRKLQQNKEKSEVS